MPSKALDISIITGLSGAGLSSVLKALEDLGLEVFDNFPLSLVDALIADTGQQTPAIAIGLDTRARGFSALSVLETIKRHQARLVFLTCDEAVLQRRFTETRRRHPLARDLPLRTAIRQERAILSPVQDSADLVLDTSELSVHDLRHLLEGHFENLRQKSLSIALTSFGYKYGLPREADIVMDVRFLNNPHWVDALRPLTGRDAAVGSYVESDPDFTAFLNALKDLLGRLLPRYEAEGKHYLTLAIGCTGGRHRSVYVVEKLAEWMRTLGRSCHVEHRDLP